MLDCPMVFVLLGFAEGCKVPVLLGVFAAVRRGRLLRSGFPDMMKIL